ncbi:MAG: VanZ family protein [Deltaproteobacteria bacterium]|nr:VanZ family protein [Deltaproteobacteria bacterium]
MKKIGAIAFLLFDAWIVYLADSNKQSVIFKMTRGIPYADKIGHFVLIGGLALMVTVALSYRKFSFFGRKIYLGGAVIAGLALAEELSQHFFPSRTMDITDALSDLAGIATAMLVCYLLERRNITCNGIAK